MMVNHSVHFSTNRSYETRQPGIDNSAHRLFRWNNYRWTFQRGEITGRV